LRRSLVVDDLSFGDILMYQYTSGMANLQSLLHGRQAMTHVGIFVPCSVAARFAADQQCHEGMFLSANRDEEGAEPRSKGIIFERLEAARQRVGLLYTRQLLCQLNESTLVERIQSTREATFDSGSVLRAYWHILHPKDKPPALRTYDPPSFFCGSYVAHLVPEALGKVDTVMEVLPHEIAERSSPCLGEVRLCD